MIALLNYIPLYCPSCGTPTRLDRADNPQLTIFRAHQALTCGICGAMYQLAERTDMLRAATSSGGDMVDYYVGDEACGSTRRHMLTLNDFLGSSPRTTFHLRTNPIKQTP